MHNHTNSITTSTCPAPGEQRGIESRSLVPVPAMIRIYRVLRRAARSPGALALSARCRLSLVDLTQLVYFVVFSVDIDGEIVVVLVVSGPDLGVSGSIVTSWKNMLSRGRIGRRSKRVPCPRASAWSSPSNRAAVCSRDRPLVSMMYRKIKRNSNRSHPQYTRAYLFDSKLAWIHN